MRPEGLTAIGLPNKKKHAHKTSPVIEVQVNICKEWIQKFCKERKTINTRISSYRLKHEVEEWSKEHIDNGAFIAAAVDSGYHYKQDGDSPNALFNLSIINISADKNN
jgi:hypothetical protein